MALSVPGAVLAARVRITIASGLVDVNRLLRQATVRRNVVVQLIRMRRDAGHPDYRGIDMRDVQRRSRELASTDEPAIPSGLVEFLEGDDEVAGEFFREWTKQRLLRIVPTVKQIFSVICSALVRRPW